MLKPQMNTDNDNKYFENENGVIVFKIPSVFICGK